MIVRAVMVPVVTSGVDQRIIMLVEREIDLVSTFVVRKKRQG